MQERIVPTVTTVLGLAGGPRGMLLQAASAGLAISGAHYYFTHPRRVMVLAPPDLLAHIADVYLLAPDGARLHAFWVRTRWRILISYHPAVSRL